MGLAHAHQPQRAVLIHQPQQHPRSLSLRAGKIGFVMQKLPRIALRQGHLARLPFQGYEVLLPARDYKNRHASILLALEAVVEAMEAAQAAA